MGIAHAKVSAKSDGADTTLIRPSDWNATHVLSGGTIAGLTGAIEFVIDGSGSTITTGIKGDIELPFGGTWTGWSLFGDATGSIVIDVWKDTYANFPATVADTITASAKPTISSATKGQSSTLTGWTTTFSTGDVLRFNVDSVATLTRATLVLKYTES